MSRGEFTYDSLRQELELVVARHNDLVVETPGYVAAMLIHEADAILAKHNVAVEAVEADGGVEGAFALRFADGAGAVLGLAQQPERASELETEYAMVDDRNGRAYRLGGRS